MQVLLFSYFGHVLYLLYSFFFVTVIISHYLLLGLNVSSHGRLASIISVLNICVLMLFPLIVFDIVDI